MSGTNHTSHGHGGHEKSDVASRPIVVAALILTVVVVVAFAGMAALFRHYAAREEARSEPASAVAAAAGRRVPPAPRLQAQPIRDLRELRAVEDAELTGYAWVDRERGIVRIPIERAIELLAERRTTARQGEAP